MDETDSLRVGGWIHVPGLCEQPVQVVRPRGSLPRKFVDKAARAVEFWRGHADWSAMAVCRRYGISTSSLGRYMKERGIRVEDFFKRKQEV